MNLCFWRRSEYRVLPNYNDEEVCEHEQEISGKRSSARAIWLLLMLAICSTGTLLFLTVFEPHRAQQAVSEASQKKCTNPSIRKEWRQLRDHEKLSYIDAVLCLTKTPSTAGTGGSMYDDLAGVHMEYAPRVHYAAPFFPWHRLFLHRYEQTLRSDCGYRGPLPYWDWTLDWNNLSESPVWDDSLGFGGDGNASLFGPLPTTKSYPRQSCCVTSGPFGSLQVMNGLDAPVPHCLSRRFFHYETQKFGKLSGLHLAPEMISELQTSENYDDLRNSTEYMVHNGIHFGVGGDFERWSSANDPIFYLHHAQIDRLWWMWQKKWPQRQYEYYGKIEKEIDRPASLQDILSFGGLGSNVTVEDGMLTENGQLCYTYQS